MGTTRIKVIDLSADQKEIKTSRKRARLASLAKRAEKLAGVAKIEKEQKKVKQRPEDQKPATTENTEGKNENTEQALEKPQISHSENIETRKEAQEETVKSSKPSRSTEQGTAKATVSSVIAKKRHHQSKKYLAAKKLIEPKTYGAKEALALLPKTSIAKFDASVEVHLNVVDKSVRAKVAFPHSAGAKQKEKKYLIFSDKKIEIKDKKLLVGDEKTIADIESGILKAGRDFDLVVANPKYMPQLAKIAKILGPKGLMPNPKNGTITEDMEKFFTADSGNTTEFKVDPTTPAIHAKIGKLSQGGKELAENLKALIAGVGPSKIRKATLTSTMGPGIKFGATSA